MQTLNSGAGVGTEGEEEEVVDTQGTLTLST